VSENGAVNSKSSEQGQLAIKKLFLQKSAFENSVDLMQTKDIKPEIKVEIDYESKKLNDDDHLVTLKLNLTATAEKKNQFSAAIARGGIFSIKDFKEDSIKQVIGVYCVERLYAYACEDMNNLLSKGGLPTMYLPPMNFQAMYQQKLKQAEKKLEQAVEQEEAVPA